MQAASFGKQTGRPADMLHAGMVLQAWSFRLAADRQQQAGSRQTAVRQQAGRAPQKVTQNP